MGEQIGCLFKDERDRVAFDNVMTEVQRGLKQTVAQIKEMKTKISSQN